MWIIYALVFSAVHASPRRLRWVGDVWLPPSGKLYTIPEIQHTFENRNVLIMGDSLSRRLTSTLALILNDKDMSDLLNTEVDNPKKLGVGGHGHKEWLVPSGRLKYQWAPHALDVASYVNKTNLQNFTDIIVAIGIHDALKPPTSIESAVRSAMDAFRSVKSNVLWRTAPKMDSPKNPKQTHEVNTRLHEFNNLVLNATDHNIHIVDTETTLNNKSVGRERLSGDTAHHFGNIARMVEIQTITHELHL